MRASITACIEISAQPDGFKIFVAITCTMPDIHASEVTTIRIRVSNVIQDGQFATGSKAGQSLQRRMKTDIIGNAVSLCLCNC